MTSTGAQHVKPTIAERLAVRTRWLGARAVCLVNGGRYRFTDRFGLRYYLWPDTRLADTLQRRVRMDDEGLLFAIDAIMRRYNESWARDPARSVLPFTAFDIGAFIGVVTIAIAVRTRPHHRVFAFEPLRRNWERVCANVALNRLTQVECLNMAVSDAPRRAKLNVSHSSSGNYLEHDSADVESVMRPTGEKIDVEVTSIESFAASRQIDRIDLVKIDAEFQDLAILRGAAPMLRAGRIHYLLVEEPPQTAAYSAEIFALLESCGYRSYHIVRRQPRLVADLARYPYATAKAPLNILAVAPVAPFPVERLALEIL